MHTHKHVTDIKVEKLPNSEAEISGVLTLDVLAECRPQALRELNQRADLPGFRPGHIPEDVLIKKVGEMAVLEETAEIALGNEYHHVMEEAKLRPIGRPQISITKLAPNEPLEFRIKVTLEPEFSLPDYKKLAAEVNKEKDDIEVTDKEAEELLKEVEKRGIKVELGEGETLADKVKENISEEKKYRAREVKRQKIMENLVKETQIDVPLILMNSELEKMMGQFRDDVTRFGKKWDEYLKEIKKTEEEIKTEWKPKAIDRVKAELIVMKIADAEKLEPATETLEHEAKHLMEHYPDADPFRVRVYVYTLLRNQKVLEFLEKVGE